MQQFLNAPLESGDADRLAVSAAAEAVDELAGPNWKGGSGLVDGNLQGIETAVAILVQLFKALLGGLKQRVRLDQDGFGEPARIDPLDRTDLDAHTVSLAERFAICSPSVNEVSVSNPRTAPLFPDRFDLLS